MLDHEELTGRVIGAAIQVHRTLGPGFLESAYEEALAIELELWRVPFQRQVEVPVIYRGIQVGTHRLDLFVDNRIVVELKAVKELRDEHFAICRAYLRAVDRKHGLLLNFSKATLEIKRVLNPQCTESAAQPALEQNLTDEKPL